MSFKELLVESISVGSMVKLSRNALKYKTSDMGDIDKKAGEVIAIEKAGLSRACVVELSNGEQVTIPQSFLEEVK